MSELEALIKVKNWYENFRSFCAMTDAILDKYTSVVYEIGKDKKTYKEVCARIVELKTEK